MAEAVPGEVRQPEVGDHGIPSRRVADRRGGEHPAAQPGQEPLVRLTARGEVLEDRCEGFQDGDSADVAPLGLFRDEPSRAGEGLPTDGDNVRILVDVSHLESCDLRAGGRPGARRA